MTKEKVNTPYDDAFRTLMVKCPTLVIPLVNEVFHEKYELQENVSVFHNEFFVGDRHQRECITDSHIGIGDRRYHAECQSSTDGSITVRIFEYDAQIAAENAQIEKGKADFVFPHSVLLYLRCPIDTPRKIQVSLRVPNGCISYEIPILKVPEYTADEILKNELYFLIPFHIFAYERELEKINGNAEQVEDLLRVYQRFARILQQKVKEERLTEYERQVIRDMTVKVVSSLASKWDNIKKGVEDIMGGEILELEVDKILNRGIDIGRTEGLSVGRTEGMSEGLSIGRTEGLIEGMITLVRDGLLDLAEGARRANMTQEEFERRVNGD